MKHIWIAFSHPWFLLILIPALFVVLFPYFRLAKKYRRTRNRVTAVVLELIVFILSVSVFAGMTIHAKSPNKSNEVILLVDVSDSEETAQKQRDDYVQQILQRGRFDKFNIGIVTFGYTQNYAVPFTDDMTKAYQTYLSAEKPDTSATNIAAALTYASGLFSSGANGKIVLITDGKETDENALSVIRGIAAQGIKIDALNVPSSFKGLPREGGRGVHDRRYGVRRRRDDVFGLSRGQRIRRSRCSGGLRKGRREDRFLQTHLPGR